MLKFRPALTLTITCVASLLVSPLTTLRAQEPGLALPERRALKQYQETKFPEEQKKIHAAAGFEVPLEIKWESIARPGEASNYLEDAYWTNIYFEPLATALAQIKADDMGAKALKEKLKKIVVTYNKDTAPASNYPNGVTFEGGTLTVNFTPFTNADDTKDRAKAIQSVLESKL